MSQTCWTPGCTGKARWISIAEPSVSLDYAHRRRCPECCDLIAELLVGSSDQYANGTYPLPVEYRRQVLNSTLDQLQHAR